MNSLQTSTSSRSARAAVIAAAVALGFGLHWGGKALADAVHAPAPQAMAANDVQAVAWNTAPAPRSASLDAAILAGGSRFDAADTLALASGSVFQVELRASRHGHAQVLAIDPAGGVTQVWQGRLRAGRAERTARLRLQGLRGTETLRVVFRADTPWGDAWEQQPTVRQLRILHV
ncbi:MAG: hypothetical protein V4864_12370 [Pseudomonadota bacterium]